MKLKCSHIIRWDGEISRAPFLLWAGLLFVLKCNLDRLLQPHLLRFSVTQNPAPMQEWTLYREVHPPHLDGFLVSRQGQFRLTALPNGRTHLEGTTWYHHSMWPAVYWRLWSDQIIHRIHRRVLNHVKNLSEEREP